MDAFSKSDSSMHASSVHKKCLLCVTLEHPKEQSSGITDYINILLKPVIYDNFNINLFAREREKLNVNFITTSLINRTHWIYIHYTSFILASPSIGLNVK